MAKWRKEAGMEPDKDDTRLKRFALQVVIMLPAENREALRVLEYAKEILEWEHREVLAPILHLIG